MAMNSGENLKIHGLTATGDLSAKQYHVAALASTARTVKVASGASAAIIGILDNDPVAGQEASVIGGGMAKALAGGTIAAGAYVTANSTGVCVATTSTAPGNKVIGKAVTGASSGQLFELFVVQSNY